MDYVTHLKGVTLYIRAKFLDGFRQILKFLDGFRQILIES